MRKLTQEEFIGIVNDRCNESIQVLSQYIRCRSKVDCLCNVCGYKWSPMAVNLTRGHGCPECGKLKATQTQKHNITQDQFLSKIPVEFLNSIEVNGHYTDQHCNIEVKCRTCGRIWVSSPYKLYREQGCESCSRKRKGVESRKPHEKFLEEVEAFHGDGIILRSLYTTNKARLNVECRQCGHTWTPMPRTIVRRGCPSCASPKGEKKIARLLDQIGYKYSIQFSFDDLIGSLGGKLRFDFAVYINDSLLLLEYDGMQHFKPISYMGGVVRYERQVKNDLIKDQYCRERQIPLLRIPYTDLISLDVEKLECKLNKLL